MDLFSRWNQPGGEQNRMKINGRKTQVSWIQTVKYARGLINFCVVRKNRSRHKQRRWSAGIQSMRNNGTTRQSNTEIMLKKTSIK